jgi:hypothetical protein
MLFLIVYIYMYIIYIYIICILYIYVYSPLARHGKAYVDSQTPEEAFLVCSKSHKEIQMFRPCFKWFMLKSINLKVQKCLKPRFWSNRYCHMESRTLGIHRRWQKSTFPVRCAKNYKQMQKTHNYRAKR